MKKEPMWTPVKKVGVGEFEPPTFQPRAGRSTVIGFYTQKITRVFSALTTPSELHSVFSVRTHYLNDVKMQVYE
jgi:hypothetical protein